MGHLRVADWKSLGNGLIDAESHAFFFFLEALKQLEQLGGNN